MEQPDIIFIVLDTQRADRLGCYGNDRGLTPNLDRFAGRSALFEQAISPAQWTIPSHASLFTGLYPTAHQVTQSNHALGRDRPHLVEVLAESGYDTAGFCNNPLVGVLNNGFKRGFSTFYNYGGAFPSLPSRSNRFPWPLNHLVAAYTQLLRRISYPIQNVFAHSDLAFRVSLNTFLTPLWSRYANFKGQNERSIKDVVHFLETRESKPRSDPLFLFVNLMETHLPFWPPNQYIDQVAPYLRDDKEARRIMHTWNREAYRWAMPLAEPLSDLELRVLNDLYDAEVAYQDAYLGLLLDTIASRARQENTITVIVSDHGDGLGEHGYMGHAFVAYQELVHVPLLVQWPRKIAAGKRIATPVSTRRIYHTLLEAAGRLPNTISDMAMAELRGLTLLETIRGRDPEQQAAYTEVYPPMNFVKAIQHRQPALIERHRCLAQRRALVREGQKLITVDNRPDELFNLAQDPLESDDRLAAQPGTVASMNEHMNRIATTVELQRDSLAAGEMINLDGDDDLLQHLRGLGYID